MNKEELNKELYDEASKYASGIEREASREIVCLTYIDAAEPREKRIAALEKALRQLVEEPVLHAPDTYWKAKEEAEKLLAENTGD